jgi:hypothetical protein
MNTQPTLSELANARPQRGKSAPERCASHKSAILTLLRERGPQGVLGSELYGRPDLYGRSPRNRICELRQGGYLIEGKAHGSSDWFYRLIRDNACEKLHAELSDWYERATGRPRPQLDASDFSSLPLFRGKP